MFTPRAVRERFLRWRERRASLLDTSAERSHTLALGEQDSRRDYEDKMIRAYDKQVRKPTDIA